MTPEWIEQLKRPEIFPERPDEVEIIQTHLSIVCLAGDRVYKLKKSIQLPFADFSTLEKRSGFCERELRLNRRLCPEIYLEVVPLVKADDGGLHFVPGGEGEADGEIVDFAVRMARMPADRMLDVLLEEDSVSGGEIRDIARRMVAFHREARRDDEVADLGSPGKLRRYALDNFEETRAMVGEVFSGALHRALERRTVADFDRFGDLLRQRADAGLVVEGHGDLHARNICMTDPVAIYDCIEFNPGFRCGDVANEHAFLVMDLRFRGHAELARLYLDAVIEAGGDEDIRRLMPMLVRYRAMVRAKVSAIAAGESEMPEKDRRESAATARRYLRLAGATAADESPAWIALCGLPATGKSTLARVLAETSGKTWPVLSSDAIRKELAGVPPDARLPGSCYTPDFSRRTYDVIYQRAESASRTHPVVLLDANFRTRDERSAAREAAGRCGVRLVVVETSAAESVVRARLEKRVADPDATSDADLAVYGKLKDEFESPDDDEADRVVRIDANREPESVAEDVLADLV
jgi:aminoglycoside phosphotransferase family enzyme/predicted kinase